MSYKYEDEDSVKVDVNILNQDILDAIGRGDMYNIRKTLSDNHNEWMDSHYPDLLTLENPIILSCFLHDGAYSFNELMREFEDLPVWKIRDIPVIAFALLYNNRDVIDICLEFSPEGILSAPVENNDFTEKQLKRTMISYIALSKSATPDTLEYLIEKSIEVRSHNYRKNGHQEALKKIINYDSTDSYFSTLSLLHAELCNSSLTKEDMNNIEKKITILDNLGFKINEPYKIFGLIYSKENDMVIKYSHLQRLNDIFNTIENTNTSIEYKIGYNLGQGSEQVSQKFIELINNSENEEKEIKTAEFINGFRDYFYNKLINGELADVPKTMNNFILSGDNKKHFFEDKEHHISEKFYFSYRNFIKSGTNQKELKKMVNENKRAEDMGRDKPHPFVQILIENFQLFNSDNHNVKEKTNNIKVNKKRI